jgi:hypothetical protein
MKAAFSSGGSYLSKSNTFLGFMSPLGVNSTKGKVSNPTKFLMKGCPQAVQKSPPALTKALLFMHLLQMTWNPSLSENGLALTLIFAKSISSYQATGTFNVCSFS